MVHWLILYRRQSCDVLQNTSETKTSVVLDEKYLKVIIQFMEADHLWLLVLILDFNNAIKSKIV